MLSASTAAGAASITYAAASIAPAAGYLTGGVFLMAAGLLIDTGD